MLKINYKNVKGILTAYSIFGAGKVDLVIEMGLGACIGEWWHIADELSKKHTVLLYERAGNGFSHISQQERTPQNIASELFELLKQIDCATQITILAHSQGALFAQQFARLYPKHIKSLVLLDPLSANDNQFKKQLTPKEYRQGGIDKSGSLYVNYILAKLHLGVIIKKIMRNAPPFYYFSDFSNDATAYILTCLTKPQFYKTAIEEYRFSHVENILSPLRTKNGFPQVPIHLITHTSEVAIQEIMHFGRLKYEEAQKIETIWQSLMKDYLSLNNETYFTQAQHSSHYIHLTEPDLVYSVINSL